MTFERWWSLFKDTALRDTNDYEELAKSAWLAALQAGTSTQQLKAEIAALLEAYPKDSWKYDSDRVNSLLADLRRLSAV